MVARDHAHSNGRSRPSDKEAGAGGRVFGSSQPDPEMSTGHFGPQFAPKIGGTQAPLLDPPLHSSQGKSLAPNP